MKNLYNAMVLFLVVTMITGLLSCTHSNNGQEMISMVIDDNDSSAQQTEIIKADNSRPLVQTGRSMLKDGKLSNLLRAAAMLNGRENCVGLDQPCGALDYCCDGLHCDGVVDGRCREGPDDCIKIDQPCGVLDHCCSDLHCDGYFNGRCRAPDYCIPVGQSCGATRIPCCDDGSCDGLVSGTCRPKDYCLPGGAACEYSIYNCCHGFCYVDPVRGGSAYCV